MKPKLISCSVCGALHPLEAMHHVHDDLVCPTCARTHVLTCHSCGQLIWRDENVGSADTPLCGQCQDDRYATCCRCGRLIDSEDAHYQEDGEAAPLCDACYYNTISIHDTGIHDYCYKPSPIFYGTDLRYFGVELEIDEAGESDSNADTLMDIANRRASHLYCKHDGSLEGGFELVTHPMSLAYHQTEMPWAEVLDQAKNMGYLSHQAGTCGLHVHVNRSAFGDTRTQQEAVIARILYFFEKHWEELLKFSRRTQRQLDQWAARYGYKEHPREILDHAKGGADRYTCVNLQNWHTIEFRIFRGTLKYNTLIATLQLVDRICDVALFMSDEQLKAMSWTTFVSGCTAPELVQYLKERQLYVNEPVQGEEEI